MKTSHAAAAFLALLLVLPSAYGQDSTTNQGEQQTEIKNKKGHEAATVSEAPANLSLKIVVVINEFAGTRKISSLPYTLYAAPVNQGAKEAANSLRYGVQVPVAEGATSWHYQHVGTNIDLTVDERNAGDYFLWCKIDRSWVGIVGNEQPTGAEGEGAAATTRTPEGAAASASRPLILSLQDSFTVVLRNGQTVEGLSAVDPVTGHVLKVDVTLTVLK